MTKRQRPVRVKVCGITNVEDALLAVECGADAIGFIFYKKSPRYVSDKEVRNIIAELPPLVSKVGVFVNATADRVNNAAQSCGLDTVQLHGDETPAVCRKVRPKVIKAVQVKDSQSLACMKDYKVDAFLLDAYSENMRGGTGKTFDWNLVLRAKKFGSIILAGGLNPSNVNEALRHVRPYAVDVSSGVEKSPGKKDPAKVRSFLRAVKGY